MRAAVIVAPGGVIKAIGMIDPARASQKDAGIDNLDAWSANCMYKAYRISIPDDMASWGAADIMNNRRVKLVNGTPQLVQPAAYRASLIETGTYVVSQFVNPFARAIVRRRG
jgi:hypothetical protein